MAKVALPGAPVVAGLEAFAPSRSAGVQSDPSRQTVGALAAVPDTNMSHVRCPSGAVGEYDDKICSTCGSCMRRRTTPVYVLGPQSRGGCWRATIAPATAKDCADGVPFPDFAKRLRLSIFVDSPISRTEQNDDDCFVVAERGSVTLDAGGCPAEDDREVPSCTSAMASASHVGASPAQVRRMPPPVATSQPRSNHHGREPVELESSSVPSSESSLSPSSMAISSRTCSNPSDWRTPRSARGAKMLSNRASRETATAV
mmetsp:Transcript_6667/g.20933  ORF Transcript_6667/g.20933 Transcript_6667/m.20933 type:complete len:258 (+) Transcript_6667:2108-2881(+)